MFCKTTYILQSPNNVKGLRNDSVYQQYNGITMDISGTGTL